MALQKPMTPNSSYDSQYYDSEPLDPEARSPRVVVPLIMSLVHPQSVVDVGCGVGRWLNEFRRLGVAELLGLDGSHIREDWLVIPANLFRSVDLRKPVILDQRFDLAVCLEVGEHLPESA